MIADTLAKYINVPADAIQRLLSMSTSQIYQDAEYQTWIEKIDTRQLDNTLKQAREAYDKDLPRFNERLAQEYGVKAKPMSSYTLGNWVIGYLYYPEMAKNLPQVHNRLPQHVVTEMLPDLITALDEMPDASEEWQRALAVLALPLLASRD